MNIGGLRLGDAIIRIFELVHQLNIRIRSQVVVRPWFLLRI